MSWSLPNSSRVCGSTLKAAARTSFGMPSYTELRPARKEIDGLGNKALKTNCSNVYQRILKIKILGYIT